MYNDNWLYTLMNRDSSGKNFTIWREIAVNNFIYEASSISQVQGYLEWAA
jgi:hypothetical protein